MTLVILFGPPAVGKMTVGYALERLTGLRLFHNHMTIELVLPFFHFGQAAFHRLVAEFRTRIFEEVAASELPGLIFTYVWALDQAGDKGFIDDVVAIFERRGAAVCFVELLASQEERLRRNESAFRLEHKPSKRDRVQSRQRLIEADRQYRLNSAGDFFYPDRYLRLDTTLLSPEVVACQIAETFGIPILSSTPDPA